MQTELLPTMASYRPSNTVAIEVRGVRSAGEIVVYHLGDEQLRLPYQGESSVAIEGLAPGCYGVELHSPSLIARTAIEIQDAQSKRMRYGFVASYPPDRDVAAVCDNIRRLHLTAVQFYDWAYRHADLLGGGTHYRDALDQPVALATVQRLVNELHKVGTSALGYAAVYAVGPQEWELWQHDALLTPSGTPYALGDFLFLVDPAAADWAEHLSQDLKKSTAMLNFDGYHLDQYGYPKWALRADGAVVDVAASFTSLIAQVRIHLPEAELIFNNVNDFPTWATTSSPQDAVYIEPWEPQLTLGSLGHLVTRARQGHELPIIIAAYQQVYESVDAPTADRSTAFTMATLFSHGATQLLAGEADRILVDPYYVRNHTIEDSTASMLKRWYDFVVEHDELLLDPSIVDITAATVGEYNDDLDVQYHGARISEEAVAGKVWRRVTAQSSRHIVHLINLVDQPDTLWDTPRAPSQSIDGGTLRIRRVLGHRPRVRIADPDASGRLIDLPITEVGDHAHVELPPLQTWQLILVELFAFLEEGQ